MWNFHCLKSKYNKATSCLQEFPNMENINHGQESSSKGMSPEFNVPSIMKPHRWRNG